MSKHDSVLAKLGLNVRKRREARELTQENLAERAGLDSTYIIRGKNKIGNETRSAILHA